MTYQEIVNRIQFITGQHKMLVDFGYGDLSDLKSRFENNSGDSAVQADYPYLFLNPGVHGRNQGMVTYNFNMVVMDMAREEVSDQPYNNMLAIQSQCQQYIDDVLAYLYFEYKDNPDVIYSGVTYIPFNERFQDNVAGMTATLTIQVPQPLDNCVAPFRPLIPPPPEGEFVLDVSSEADYVIQPDTEQSPLKFTNTIIDTFSGMRPLPLANYYSILANGTWTFQLSGVVRRTTNIGVWPDSPNMVDANPSFDLEPDVTNWPVNAVVGVDYPFSCTWTNIPLTTANNYVAWRCTNEPAIEDQGLILAGASLKGYYIA